MSTPLKPEEAISRRKLRHLDVCADPRLAIEDPRGAGWRDLSFVHEALPELDADKIETEIEFLGYRCGLPLLISCMTGGTGDGAPFNRQLARLAEAKRLPLGLGSIRPFLEDPALQAEFALRREAPSVPLLANLGAAQLASYSPRKILQACQRLEVDALVVHLNPGQEIFQAGGDRDFRGVVQAIGELVESLGLPVIVKETGQGIRPRRARELLALGVEWVDLAGAGGTDWLQVEACRQEAVDGLEQALAQSLIGWGLKTAVILGSLAREGLAPGSSLQLKRSPLRVIASGGIRSGLDLALALALGAGLGGIALPLVRGWALEGEAGLEGKISELEVGLRRVMFLVGAGRPSDLLSVGLLLGPRYQSEVEQLSLIETAR